MVRKSKCGFILFGAHFAIFDFDLHTTYITHTREAKSFQIHYITCVSVESSISDLLDEKNCLYSWAFYRTNKCGMWMMKKTTTFQFPAPLWKQEVKIEINHLENLRPSYRMLCVAIFKFIYMIRAQRLAHTLIHIDNMLGFMNFAIAHIHVSVRVCVYERKLKSS